MSDIWSFIWAHQTTFALIAMWLFSNVVTALPSPTNASGNFYKFLFAFVNGLAGSLPRVFPQARVLDPATQNAPSYFKAPVGN